MLIMIAGLPGSGKSYFAEKLAERLEAVYISSDLVRKSKHALGQYALQDKFKVYNEMVRLATHALKEHKTVIVDATFYQQPMRDLFFNLAKTFNEPTIFIEVYADEDLIRERLKKTREHSEADFTVYKKVKNDFENITEPHLRLQSNNENIQNMLNSAIQYINNEHDRA